MSYIVEFGFNWLALFLLFSLFFIFIGLILINIYIEEKCLFIRYSPVLVMFIGIIVGGWGFHSDWKVIKFKRMPPVECISMSQMEKFTNIYDCDNVKLYVEKGSKVAEKDPNSIITEYYKKFSGRGI